LFLKGILRYFCGIVVGMLVATAAVGASRDDTEIQHWLNQHAQRANSAEVAAAHYRVVGDLDGDDRNDIAVLYTLRKRSGQRGESRYLAVFRRHASSDGRTDERRGVLRYHAHVLVSGPGAGEATRATILQRSVVVEMLTFRTGDAACCPTHPATRRYRLTARGLTLVRDKPSK
jgi:hypothetical protein